MTEESDTSSSEPKPIVRFRAIGVAIILSIPVAYGFSLIFPPDSEEKKGTYQELESDGVSFSGRKAPDSLAVDVALCVFRYRLRPEAA